MPKKTLNIRLREDLADLLKKESERIGVPQIRLIEESLDEALDHIVARRAAERQQKLNSSAASSAAKASAAGVNEALDRGARSSRKPSTGGPNAHKRRRRRSSGSDSNPEQS